MANLLCIIKLFAIANTKRPYNSGNQQERYQTTLQRQDGSSNPPAVPVITQTFYPGQSGTDITNEQAHQNVSYHAVAPEIGTNLNYTLQVPGVATTRVNISHKENESTLVYNHAYDTSGSDLYEELDIA